MMRSSDFGSIVSPIGSGVARRAKGGAAQKKHLTLVIASPAPMMPPAAGALAHIAMLGHLAGAIGALRKVKRRRK